MIDKAKRVSEGNFGLVTNSLKLFSAHLLLTSPLLFQDELDKNVKDLRTIGGNLKVKTNSHSTS